MTRYPQAPHWGRLRSVLVTVIGSTGVLGRRVVELLLERGHTVRALARSRPAAARLPAGSAVVGDVWDEGFLRVSLTGADAVLMVATSIPSGARALKPSAWRANDRVRSALAPTVARIAGEVGVRRLVQESVIFVYADAGSAWVSESSPLDPARQARSCLDAERAARNFADMSGGDAQSVVLRFGLFVSPDSGMSRQVWEQAIQGRSLVLGDLAGYETFVHVHDAATAAVHALGVPGGTYNVGATPITRQAWLTMMSGLAGRAVAAPPAIVREGLPKAIPAVRGLARSIRMDSSALQATGWEPRYATADAVWSAVSSGEG